MNPTDLVHIYSNKRRAYWKDGAAGYTPDIREAGQFRREYAETLTSGSTYSEIREIEQSDAPPEKISMEAQYKAYLERVGLKEVNMHPTQIKETKRAFYGAAGQLLILFRDTISNQDPDQAVQSMLILHGQVQDFWDKQE